MNKVVLINGKGITECFSNMCSGNDTVEIEFELENMSISNKEDTINVCKYLNTLYNDKKTYYKEWVLVSHYPSAILLKGVDSSGNVKYLKIIKGGDRV